MRVSAIASPPPRPPSLTRRLGLAFKAFRTMLFSPYGGSLGASAVDGWGNAWYGSIGGNGLGYDYAAGAGAPFSNVAVAANLRVLRTNVSEPDLRVMEGDRNGNEVPVWDAPAAALIKNPNPFYSYDDLMGALTASIKIDGNGYLVKIRSRAGVPVQLWWVAPWTMIPRWPVGDPSVFIDHWDYRPYGGAIYRLEVDDVIHVRDGEPDERRGCRVHISEIKAAASRTMCSLNECDAFIENLMRHAGIPPVVIKPTAGGMPPSPEDAEAMTADYRSLLDGARRGDPFIVTGPFEVVPLGLSPEHLSLDMIPSRLEDQICALLGVPAMLTGLTSGGQHKTYSNYEEARKSFYEDTLIPLQNKIAKTLTKQLMCEPGMGNIEKQKLMFDYSQVKCMQEDRNAKALRVSGLYQAGVFTRRRALHELGEDGDHNDDLYLVGRGQQFLRVGEEVPPFVAPSVPPGNPNVPPGSGGGVSTDAVGAGTGGGAEAPKGLDGPVTNGHVLVDHNGHAPMVGGKNCGTGHGGFQEGNTCQPSGGGGGGGGGSGGGAATAPASGTVEAGGDSFSPQEIAQLQAHAASLGASVGSDWTLQVVAPRTPSEGRAAAVAAAKGRFLVHQVDTPSLVTAPTAGGTAYSVGGTPAAQVMPNPNGAGFVARKFNEGNTRNPFDDSSYPTQAAAEKAAASWSKLVQKQQTNRQYDKPRDLATFFAAEAAAYPSGSAGTASSTVVYSVITTPAAKALLMPGSEGEDDHGPFPATAEAKAAIDPDEVVARQLLADARQAVGVPDGDTSAAGRRTILHALATTAEARMRADAQVLIDDLAAHTGDGSKGLAANIGGKIGQWASAAASYLRGVFLAGALAVSDPPTPATAAALDAATTAQLGFLDDFAHAVASGGQALGPGLVARAGSYGAAAWRIGADVERAQAADHGASEGMRVLGSANPCNTCLDEASKGWQPIEDILPIGDSPCQNRCHCWIEYREYV